MTRKRRSTILNITLLIMILCGIIVTQSVYNLSVGWANYRQASRLHTIEEASVHFTDGLINFMFDRGRTNVVLSDGQPVSDQNALFLMQRRTLADEAFERGFSAIALDYPGEAEELRRAYDDIRQLRGKVDNEAVLYLEDRDPDLRELWFDSCTDYIRLVLVHMEAIGRRTHDDYLISNYFESLVDALHFRSIVGRESSVFTAAIQANAPVRDGVFRELLTLRGVSGQIWSSLEQEVAMIGSAELQAALEEVRETYYLRFRPHQDRLLDLAMEGMLPEDAAGEIAALSVPALDTISAITEVAIREAGMEIDDRIGRAYVRLIGGIVLLVFGLLVMAVVPVVLYRSFVRPLKAIVGSIDNLSGAELDTVVPYQERCDEIGILANGVHMLQTTMTRELALRCELNDTVSHLEELSIRDPLTGLYNRRYARQVLEQLEGRHRITGQPYAVIIADVDLFKEFNDRYGHECGDRVLTEISPRFADFCRESDLVARWGGEEFLFLLPDTDEQGARILAERIRQDLEQTALRCGEKSLTITMTFGVAQYKAAYGTDGTLNNADKALFEGKNLGRNQVRVFQG